MQILFVPSKILIVIIAVLCCELGLAQERSTKGTKIILAVNEESDVVEHIELLVSFQKMGAKPCTKSENHDCKTDKNTCMDFLEFIRETCR